MAYIATKTIANFLPVSIVLSDGGWSILPVTVFFSIEGTWEFTIRSEDLQGGVKLAMAEFGV